MPAGLDRFSQQDFSAGMFQSVAPDRIPANGAYDIRNGLLDEDGAVYRRGGGNMLTTPVASSGVPRLVWTGTLVAGQRTVVITSTKVFTYAAGVLTSVGAYTGMASAVKAVAVLDGIMYLPGGFTFDGSTLSSGATSGAHVAAVANRILLANGDRVKFSVISHLGTGDLTTGSPNVANVKTTAGAFQVGQDIVGAGIPLGTTISAVGAGTLTLSANATATATGVPLTATGGQARFDATDYHRLPTGVTVTGLAELRDSAAVFTTQGLWVISGLAANLTDADGNVQQRLDQYSRDLRLWAEADGAIVGWEGSLIVPALDGVWLISRGITSEASSPIQLISGPISNLYRGYVRDGWKPGQATVFRGHYLLPVLSPSGVRDVLICRLDATNWRGQRTFPWTHASSNNATGAGTPEALAIALDGTTLLGAMRDTPTTTALASLLWFAPAAGQLDPDGLSAPLLVWTRQQPAGATIKSTFVKTRLKYELAGSGSVQLNVSLDDGTFATLTPIAPDNSVGGAPFTWQIARRARAMSFQISAVGPVTAKVSAVDVFFRASGRQ